MRVVKTISGAALALGLALGGALAQSTAPAPTAPAAAAPATAAPMDKKALSKACSAQADQQGLHGKARKKFRSQCRAGKA